MGHLSHESLKQLAQAAEEITFDKDVKLPNCEPCNKAFAKRKPFGTAPRAEKEGELIHVDLVFPLKPTAYNGSKGYISMTDDSTGEMEVYFIKKKTEARDKLEEYCAHKKASKTPVAAIGSDGERVIIEGNFRAWMKKEGIQWRPTVAYHPEQNGMAEVNQHILHLQAIVILQDAGLPPFLWPLALEHVGYLKNRSPLRRLKWITPIEKKTGRQPDLTNLYIWGSEVWYHIPKEKRIKSEKITSCSKMSYLVGYDSHSIKVIKI